MEEFEDGGAVEEVDDLDDVLDVVAIEAGACGEDDDVGAVALELVGEEGMG